jgi:hypothetical protein
MMLSRRSVGLRLISLAALGLAVAAPARAQVVAVNTANGLTGSQTNFGGSLGHDFNVLGIINVVALGAFDSANGNGVNDGFSNTITVYIYNRDTGLPVTSITFSNGSPGTIANNSSYRFKTLGSSIQLTPGFHGAIVAENFGPTDPNGNTSLGDPAPAFDAGGGAISFGVDKFGNAGVLPTNADTARYQAGSFQYTVVALPNQAPEPGVLALLAGLGVSGTTLAFRRLRRKR